MTAYVKALERIALVQSCPMQLQFFPFDNQVCPMIIESYTNSADLIDLQWARIQNELTCLRHVITLYQL